MNRLDEMFVKLKKDMKAKKIKGIVLAEELGVSNTTVSNILNGKHASMVLLKKVCEYVAEK